MRVLIFKVNQLGDNVVFLPVVQALRRVLPEAKLAVMTSPLAAPLYESCVAGCEVAAVPTREFNGSYRRPARFMRYWARVRAMGPTASLLGEDQGNVALLLARLSGGAIRVGAEVPYVKFGRFLTDRVSFPPDARAAEVNWEMGRLLLRRLGKNAWDDKPPAPDLGGLTGGAARRKGLVVVHEGASRDYKKWGGFGELAERLARDHEVRWLTGPGEERPPSRPGIEVVMLRGLQELARAIAEASLFVGNNSGPMNLASAMGVRSVILNGPSNSFWDPYWNREKMVVLRTGSLWCQPCDSILGPANQCLNRGQPMACLKMWSVETVEGFCRRWLESGPDGAERQEKG